MAGLKNVEEFGKNGEGIVKLGSKDGWKDRYQCLKRSYRKIEDCVMMLQVKRKRVSKTCLFVHPTRGSNVEGVTDLDERQVLSRSKP